MITKKERLKILNFFKENNNTKLPYSIKISSKKHGKDILISGSIHGNEPVGPRFAYNFINDFWNKKFSLESGSITFVLANYQAFEKNQRYIDTDMNRIFIFPKEKEKEKTSEYSRAIEIDNFVKNENFDFGIDLHSVSVGDFQIYICDRESNFLRKLIEETSTVETLFYFDDKYIPGTFMNQFKKYGSKGVGLECGNHSSSMAIETAQKQVLVLLEKFGIIKNEKFLEKYRYPEKLKIYDNISMIKAGDNFRWLVPNFKTGISVKKNQKLCIDDQNGIQKAPEDSYLFMPMIKISYKDNDAGFLCNKL